MNLQDFNDLVIKLLSEGKKPLDAVKIVEDSGMFNEKVIDEFWGEFNKRRSFQINAR